ncbi:MAG TPA: AbrB/MazE/SpoVT family DNA-binding domain-containing protein [Aliidongia sp.]|nr:AbrB/MazE/SpoVT family DNA-binding domain-containing protein [Aliidongia sp.]
MKKAFAKLMAECRSLSLAIPKEMLDAAGLKQGDDLSLLLRDDGTIEIRRLDSAEATLEAAFEWSLTHYGPTYRALAK